jgi:hypothetical protein
MKGFIWFDMDGTIANLYGVENWLNYLMNGDIYPYAVATPLLRMCSLAKVLNRLQRQGYGIGIISWLSKSGTDEYNKKVTNTKKEWLKKHLKSVEWDVVNIVNYGTPKERFMITKNDILFDDEERNRNNWKGIAYNVDCIMEVLKAL